MPFCKNCGAENNPNSKFCVKCGTPIEQPQVDFNSIPQGGYAQPDFNNVPQGEPVQPDFNSIPQEEAVQSDFNNAPQEEAVQPDFSNAPQGGYAQPDFNNVPQGGYAQPDFNNVPQGGYAQPDFNNVPQGGYAQPDFNNVPQGGYAQPDFSNVPQGGYAQPDFSNVPQGGYVQPKEKKPVNKKLIIILAVVAVLVVAIIVTAIVIFKNIKHKKEIERKTIKLEEYIDVTFEGYDTIGTAYAKIDYDKFYVAALEAMGKTEKTTNLKTIAMAETLYYSIDIELDKKKDLSNGDEITVDIEYDEDIVKQADVIIDFDSYEIEVEGLDEVEVVDIFDYAEVTFGGFDGDVYASVKNTADKEGLKTVWFDVSNSYNLSIGDTITVSVDSYYEENLLDYYGIKLEKLTMDYTVTENDVDRYINKLSDIGDELMDTLKTDAMTEIENTYGWYSGRYEISDLEYYGAYLMYPKADGEKYNTIAIIYTATLTPNEDYELDARTIYIAVEIEDIIQRADGTQEYDDWYLSIPGYSYLGDTYYSYYGYETEKDMFEDIIIYYVEEYGYTYEISDGLKDYYSADDDDSKTEDETSEKDDNEDETDASKDENDDEDETSEK